MMNEIEGRNIFVLVDILCFLRHHLINTCLKAFVSINARSFVTIEVFKPIEIRKKWVCTFAYLCSGAT